MGNNIVTTILALIAGGGVMLGYLLIQHMMQRKKQSQELSQRLGPSEFGMGEGDEAILSMEKKKSPLAESLEQVLRFLLPLLGKNLSAEEERLRADFTRAGIESADAPILYIFWQWVMSVLMVLLALPLLFSDAEGTDRILNIFLGILLIVLGLFGPRLYLKNSITKRTKTLLRSFPDTLDLLLVCVESGLAMDAALTRVCHELGSAHPEITKELNRTRLELALLNDRSKALYNLGERTDIVAFRSLAAALIQTEKFGTNLTDTLRVMADDYRQTRLLLAEQKAGRLPALITLPLITMLLPSFMLIILGPAILRVIAQGGIFGGR